MNKRVILLRTMLLFIVSVIGCSDKEIAIAPTDTANKSYFAIYLVKNTKTSEAIQTELGKLEIEPQPFISDKDLVSYNWKNHTLELKQSLSKKAFDEFKLSGTPFVLVVENQRIYSGALWSLASSASTNFPVIVVSSDKLLKIQRSYAGEKQDKLSDPRTDSRIYNALRKAGKLLE